MVGVVLALLAAGSGAAQGKVGERYWVEAKARKVASQRSEIVKVAHDAMPAVVSITTRSQEANPEDAQKGLGSGFIIHPDGYILTSSHVIEDASEIRITLPVGRGLTEDYVAKIVGQDAHTDIALLKIDAGRKLPVLPLATAKNVEVADWVVVIGNPFGLSHSVTVGVVSYKGRTDVVPNGRTGYFDYLQTDASINPGNSGGPILDLNGEVVAIANAVNVAGQGIGFAVPIDIAKAVLPQLYTQGAVKRGWMGVTVQDITPEVGEVFGEKSWSGVIVSEVAAGSPGEEAGIHVGDVITTMDEHRVERAHALRWKVATRGSGKPVALTLRRSGKPVKVSVVLGEMPVEQKTAKQEDPAQPSASDDTEPAASSGLGATITDVDDDAESRAGLTVAWGALIKKLTPNSALANAGLIAGDVVLKVDNSEVGTGEQLVDALSQVPSGEAVRLFVRRGKSTLPFVFRKP